ncbi:6005_t:CDS:2, partial [Rhizophagus irregularis]
MALRQETFLRTAAIKPKSTVVPLINICPKGVTCCDDGHTCEGDYPVCCQSDCIPTDYPVCCQDGCIPADTTCCDNGGYCEK